MIHILGRMMTWRKERSKILQTGRSGHVLSAGSLSKVGEEEQFIQQSKCVINKCVCHKGKFCSVKKFILHILAVVMCSRKYDDSGLILHSVCEGSLVKYKAKITDFDSSSMHSEQYKERCWIGFFLIIRH